MFDWVENRFLASGQGFQILSSLLCPVYKLNRENTQPEDMCDIAFEKTKACGRTLNNRTSDYAEAAVWRVL